MKYTIEEVLARLQYSRRLRKIHGPKKSKKFMYYTWSANEVNIKQMDNDKVFIGASDYGDFVFTNLLEERKNSGFSIYTRELKIFGNKKQWHKFIEEKFGDYMIIEINDSTGFVVIDKEGFIRYNVNSNSVSSTIYGDQEFISEIVEVLTNNFDIVTSYIEWVYSGNGESVNVPLNTDRLPVDQMYPFLEGEKLTEYYDRFLNSSANILLLIGPPGTGKTTFIRGLLAYSNSSAIVTYDAAILEKDYVFARFIEDETNMMVLEDSDNFLSARSEGNTMMHRFLNVGDGLVTTKGKKMIFSTNLPSIRDVDPALIRPGRCFDVLCFRTLSQKEAEVLANQLGFQLEGKKDSWSIAEVFNKQSEKTISNKINRRMGFF